MKQLVISLVLACTVWCGAGGAQPAAAPPAQTAAGGEVPAVAADRFTASREAADMRKATYQDLDKRNMAEIDRLMTTKKCQINRIAPLLDDTILSMNDWLAAEKKYWDLWNDAESRRVEDLRTTLANLEADAVRIAKLVDTENEGLQELQRQKAILETDTRTAEVVAKIDGVVKDIRDSEARLGHASQEQESVSARIRELKASISTRLVGIRENLVKLDAWQVDNNAYYAERRTSANDACQVTRPADRSIPAAKKKAN